MKLALRLLDLQSLVVAVIVVAGLCVPVLQFPLSLVLSLISALQDGRPSPLCHSTRGSTSMSVLIVQ